MKKIKCVIVEDEDVAREVLVAYLNKYCPQVEILAWADNARDAVETIQLHQPELLFLDVEIPYGNAFDVLEACQNLSFETIFVTAYSEYALRALNASASYYLLKPLNIEELIKAVQVVEENLQNAERLNRTSILLEQVKQNDQKLQKLVIPTVHGFEVVSLDEVVRLQANGNFTDIILQSGQKKMACRFLKHYEDLLAFPFLRVHRSHIINCDFVRAYNKGGFIEMLNSDEVELSTSYKESFLGVFR
jgi:two-component system, LytTR family, response regulator